MYSMFQYTHNEDGILQSIMYSKQKIREDFEFLLLTSIFFALGMTLLFFLSSQNIVSIFIPIFCSIIFFLGMIMFWAYFCVNKRSKLIFTEKGITLVKSKKSMTIQYDNLKQYGVLRRVGSIRFSRIFSPTTTTEVGIKNTFYFSTTEKINLKRLSYNVNTSMGFDFGFFKGIAFYISDYVDSTFYVKCKEAINYYYPENSVQVVDKD